MGVMWDYFPRHKGLVLGIVLCGKGIGPFIFNMLATMVVNPDNLKVGFQSDIPDDEVWFPARVTDRVPLMLYTLICFWLILILFSTVTMDRSVNYEKF